MTDEEYLMYVKRVDFRLESLSEHLERSIGQNIELEKYRNHELYYSICRSTNMQNFSYISHLSFELIYCLRALRDKVEHDD